MSDSPELSAGAQACWNDTGVWGNRSCPRLQDCGHCRNCEVYGDGGRRLLERDAPEAYLDEWVSLISEAKAAEADATVPCLAFRVGQSWFAVRARSLRELTPPSVVRRVPHQRSTVLLGLTAVRGEIVPCFSLHALMGEPRPEPAEPSTKFLVLRHRGADWVFPVDAVSGVHDVAEAAIEPLPATMSMAGGVYTTGIAMCGGQPAGLLDEDLLVHAIERTLA